MKFELDHLLVCTGRGAPEGDELVRFGLREGPPNRHPGQGTACRRFPFKNAMIELIWVEDESEARSEETRRTMLWERWSQRDRGVCPFGVCVRPAGDGSGEAAPFPAWAYKPSYLPDPLAMEIGDAGVDEPMWVYLGFMRRADRERHFAGHPAGVREISGLTLTSSAMVSSATAEAMLANGVLSTRTGERYLLEVELDGGRSGRMKDFQPGLPLMFRF